MAKIDVCEFPTYEEMGKKAAEKALYEFLYDGKSIREWMQIIASEDAISRQAVLDTLDNMDKTLDEDRTVENYKELLKECYEILPPVTPKPKTGYISIDDVMSVFDDFMCGEVDEEGTETFLEMLKDKAKIE